MSNIAKRIREVRKASKLTMAQLGAACGGKTPQAVYGWEHGKTVPSAEDVLTIARLTNTTFEFLMTGKGGHTVPPATLSRGRVVPAVPWDFILAFQSNNYIPDKSVRSHFDCTALSFASIVEDDANAPDIKKGDSVIVDPDQVPAPGDYVVAKVKGAPVLRRFQPRDGSVHLSASNPDYPSFTVTDWLDSYVGTITETARPRRR